MRVQVTTQTFQADCPIDVRDYLLNRGWSVTVSEASLWSLHARPDAMDFSWAEALAYENFRHLFLMKPKEVTEVVTQHDHTFSTPKKPSKKAP